MEKMDIYDLLKNRIITMEYEPGQLLNEVEIAKELGTSRTPIRNVFLRLEDDDLVNIIPRFGVQVSFVDLTNVKSLFELTKVLDPMAARLATNRLTEEQIVELKSIVGTLNGLSESKDYQEAISYDEKFHKLIINSCGNIWLIDGLKRLHMHTERLWHYCHPFFKDMSVFTHTFDKILTALETGNERDVEKYSLEHIEEFTSHIKKALF